MCFEGRTSNWHDFQAIKLCELFVGCNWFTVQANENHLPQLAVVYNLFSGRITLVAQRPIVIKLSRGRSVYVCTCVGRSVGLSSALWKNGASDPDAVWHRRSDGCSHEAGSGVWGSVHRKGTFGGEFGVRHRNQWVLYGIRVRHRRDAALFPNYFGQTCLHTAAFVPCKRLVTCACYAVSKQLFAEDSLRNC